MGWDAVAEAYAETFAPLCAGTFPELLAAAGLGANRPAATPRLLDVGTGPGDLAALARTAGAMVTAVDADAGMLRIAARRAPGVELHHAALPELPFPDGSSAAGFDVVTANFVLNHVPDPRRAAAELARVSAPGGRVAVTIWPSGHNVQSRLWAAVIDESGAVPPPSTRLPEELDFPRTVDGLAALLTDAGLRDVEARPLRWTHRTDPDALWNGAAAGVGGIGVTVTSQPAPVRARMRAAYDRLVQPLLEDGLLRLDTEAVLAVGSR
ncbi:class I SAM-dependent methyltransferase [Nocardioides ferulae]|uniref:class I SAM-dependent methyltransferase n=1 Tax=Nocardioides ferulae TaxID=2340821 RepID=UPI0013DE0B5C|nr:class I SAM-dependent methyltransferase [Nocardioides ferulae]